MEAARSEGERGQSSLWTVGGGASGTQVARAALVNALCLVTAAEEMAPAPPTSVPALRVSPQQPFHSDAQVGLRRLHHHMKVVAHQHVGMDLPTRLCTGLSQGLQKTLPILFVL